MGMGTPRKGTPSFVKFAQYLVQTSLLAKLAALQPMREKHSSLVSTTPYSHDSTACLEPRAKLKVFFYFPEVIQQTLANHCQ